MTKSIEEELVVPHPSMKSQPSDIPDADNVKPLVDTACFKACATHATSKHAYATHPLDPLTSSEIRAAAAAALSVVPKPKTPESSSSEASSTEGSGSVEKPHARFSYITLREPHKKEVAEWVMSKQKEQSEGNDGSIGDRGTHSVMVPAVPIRVAEAVLMVPATGLAYKVLVQLAATTEASASTKDEVLECVELPRGTQPCFTPDDCFLAEAIVKADPRVQELVLESFGIEDLSMLACDPWSVHLADPAGYAPLKWREQNTETQGQGKLPPPRLVQTFLYRRDDEEDNHYAHPLPLLPVVDLNAEQVVALQGADDPDLMSQPIPSASVNYHRRKLASNDYLPKTFRAEPPKPLDITQPEGPSFTVHGRNEVTWQGWSFRVGFNYREALVVHDVRFQGRSVLARASLVEMTVPYAEPRAPFQSKNAGDVGDYGLGYCTTSLELCSDCNGDITYFDAVLADSHGEPYTVKKAVCMHEEDGGVLWKHVEYRNPEMAETRRARVLVLQSSYTVVNYEYLSYVTFGLDGSIAFDLKLTGELSTNLATKDEQTCGTPDYGTFVAPGVNAQLHQHQFCYRLDMAIDGSKNRVVETTLQPVPRNPKTNPYGNAIQKVSVPLETETAAIRPQLPPGGSWRIENAEGAKNEVNGQPTAYKLMPNTRGSPQPLLMTDAESAVSLRGAFATASLWVTPYSPDERYPAGEFPTQSIVTPGDLPSDGLAKWTSQDRNINGEDIVLWHSFGVTHVPRVEDFPVMPVEVTGFMLKPDGFFSGNPAIDLPPEPSGASKQCCIPAL